MLESKHLRSEEVSEKHVKVNKESVYNSTCKVIDIQDDPVKTKNKVEDIGTNIEMSAF